MHLGCLQVHGVLPGGTRGPQSPLPGQAAPCGPSPTGPSVSAPQGRVCGLCGNFDDNAANDFTTRSQSVVGDVLEFGNSWKFSPSCPDAPAPRDPCTANPYRKSWAQKQCSIINGPTFAACHAHVRAGFLPEVGGQCHLAGEWTPFRTGLWTLGSVRLAMWDKAFAVPEVWGHLARPTRQCRADPLRARRAGSPESEALPHRWSPPSTTRPA